jgi:hypothetical protein
MDETFSGLYVVVEYCGGSRVLTRRDGSGGEGGDIGGGRRFRSVVW